jgi:hypothetical protein
VAIDYRTAHDIKESYEDAYQIRHQAFKDLRRWWHGDYWKIAQQSKTSRSIVSVFRDMQHSGSETLPDMKLVKNVVHKICVKYQTFLSPLPMISVYVDPPGSDLKRRQATTKERYLYGVWNDGQMSRVFNREAWYLPLMGDCFKGIYPDFDRGMPVPMLRSPECAYPITNFDGSDEDVYLFAWKERQSVIKRQFPNYVPTQKGKFPIIANFTQRGKDPDPEVEILEYSDGKEFARWCGEQKMNGVVHDLGFNLFEHEKFIDVPDEPWGHGAVEQLINQNEALNALESLLFQSVLMNVFPKLVLIDPSKAPEEIYVGPGAVIPVNQGGDVKELAPAVGALPAQMGFIGAVEHGMKEDAGLNETSFGVSPASSIVTGQAIEDLQNAGTASTVEMVQATGLGACITRWNSKAISIGQRMFTDKKINLFGMETLGLGQINPRRFAMNITGKELIGSTRNEVVFMPQYDLHTKVVIGLQMAGGGLVSKAWQQRNAGIPDTDAMAEEMLDEAIETAVVGAFLGALQQEPTPENAQQVEQQAVGYIAGATPGLPAPVPHPLIGPAGASPIAPGGPAGGGASPPGAMPPGGGLTTADLTGRTPGGGAIKSAPFPQPPGSPIPAGAPGAAPAGSTPGPQGAPAPQSNVTQLADAQAAIGQIQGLQGKVFLVGEIVATGQTSGPVEIAVTVKADSQLIQSSVPFQVQIHVITGKPSEQSVEVTPGVTPTPPSPQ